MDDWDAWIAASNYDYGADHLNDAMAAYLNGNYWDAFIFALCVPLEAATDVMNTAVVEVTGGAVNPVGTVNTVATAGKAASAIISKYDRVSTHHIFSDKNCKRGNKWTDLFRPIFEEVGIDISKSPLNLVRVKGHYGPHPNAYHEYVYGKLLIAIRGTKPGSAERKAAIIKLLGELAIECATPGTVANSLITYGDDPND